MQTFEANLGYQFRNPALLTQALTRKAFAIEERQKGRQHEDQEILSTLGDAVLKAAFVDLLVRAHYPTPNAITQEKKNLERHDGPCGEPGTCFESRTGGGGSVNWMDTYRGKIVTPEQAVGVPREIPATLQRRTRAGRSIQVVSATAAGVRRARRSAHS